MLKLQVAPGTPAVMPPQNYHKMAGTGAPFASVESVAGAEGTETLFGSFVAKGVAALWDKLTGIKDILIFLTGIHVLHMITVSKFANTDTVYDGCASNSWMLFFYVLVLVAVTALTSIVRSIRPLSILFETLLTVLMVTIAIVLAAGVGPHRWALQQGATDYCSAQANPLSREIYWLADVAGSGSVVGLALILLARKGVFYLVLLAVVAIALQFTLIDLVIVEELSAAWRSVEINGTEIDSTLADVTDRLEDLESLFNTTI